MIREVDGQECYCAGGYKPVPVYKQVLRSSCHGQAMTQEMREEEVEILCSTKTRVKKTWTGRWICNACAEICETYSITVMRKDPYVALGIFQCVSEFEGLVKPGIHYPDTSDMKCRECGDQTLPLFYDTRTVGYYNSLKRSKLLTFHACNSVEKARELGCPHSETCRLNNPERTTWGKAQEIHYDSYTHISQCPPLVKKPKTVAKGYIQKSDIAKKREECRDSLQDALKGMFDSDDKEVE